jgi:hypothetical protein
MNDTNENKYNSTFIYSSSDTDTSIHTLNNEKIILVADQENIHGHKINNI